MTKFYTSVILLINQSKEICEKQFSVFGSRGGQIIPLTHVPLFFWYALYHCVLFQVSILYFNIYIISLYISYHYFSEEVKFSICDFCNSFGHTYILFKNILNDVQTCNNVTVAVLSHMYLPFALGLNIITYFDSASISIEELKSMFFLLILKRCFTIKECKIEFSNII